jgi:hypothetical protein
VEKSPNQHHKTTEGGLHRRDLLALCGRKSTGYSEYEERAQIQAMRQNKNADMAAG